jgi:hypothetical protein
MLDRDLSPGNMAGVPILCQEVPRFSPFSFKALSPAIRLRQGLGWRMALELVKEVHKKKGSPG